MYNKFKTSISKLNIIDIFIRLLLFFLIVITTGLFFSYIMALNYSQYSFSKLHILSYIMY